MSAVKIFALGVLMTGSLASSTLAGSMHGGHDSPASATPSRAAAPITLTFAQPVGAAPRTFAAENLAGNWTSFGSSNGGSIPLGTSNGGSLDLGTSQSSSPINLGGTTYQAANASAIPSQPAMSLYQLTSGTSQGNSSSNTPGTADAFINFGNGPFSESSSLTTGNPQSFLNSPAFTNVFGGKGPSSQDVTNFENQVLSTVQKTYNAAGLPIHLTTDPNVPAAHTMSVVSNASNPESPGAIGITDVGNNGFSFIDKFSGVSDPNQLATAIGHNLAHELMHAFGISNHPEANGPYVDAASTTLSSLSDPNTTFSPAAASLLSTLNFQATGQSVTAGTGSQKLDGDQMLITEPSTVPVPEPSTIALWTLAGGLAVAYRRRRSA